MFIWYYLYHQETDTDQIFRDNKSTYNALLPCFHIFENLT